MIQNIISAIQPGKYFEDTIALSSFIFLFEHYGLSKLFEQVKHLALAVPYFDVLQLLDENINAFAKDMLNLWPAVSLGLIQNCR